MALPLSLRRVLLQEDYIRSNGTRVNVLALPLGDSTPTSFTLTVAAGGAAIGATSIPITAPLQKRLYAGELVKFGAVEAYLASDVAAGVTALPVENLVAAVIAASTFTTLGLVPMYSSQEATTQLDEETLKGRNFLAGIWKNSSILNRGWEIPISGLLVRNDPALENLRDAKQNTQKVYIEIINPEGQGGEKGAGFITKWKLMRKEDAFIEVSFTLMGDGPIEDIPVTP
jgi:Phage tail tube protein